MKLKLTQIVRTLLIVITVFIALTAIGGGVAMLAGLEDFPLEWLRNTAFKTYTIPAILLVFVGASSLISAFMLFRKLPYAPLVVMFAGLVMVGYITVEVLILEQGRSYPHWTEFLYFSLGGLVFILAFFIEGKRPSNKS